MAIAVHLQANSSCPGSGAVMYNQSNGSGAACGGADAARAGVVSRANTAAATAAAAAAALPKDTSCQSQSQLLYAAVLCL
jgi:hypothetical protein